MWHFRAKWRIARELAARNLERWASAVPVGPAPEAPTATIAPKRAFLSGLVPDTSSSSSPSSVDPTTASFASLAGAHEALGGLPVLDAYVRECLRLYSTAPNGLIKEVPKNGPPARVGEFPWLGVGLGGQ